MVIFVFFHAVSGHPGSQDLTPAGFPRLPLEGPLCVDLLAQFTNYFWM